MVPQYVVSALDGLRAGLTGTQVRYAPGAVAVSGVSALPLEEIRNPVTGEPGMRAEFIGFDGSLIRADDRLSTDVKWLGGVPTERCEVLRLSLDWTPQQTGTVQLAVGTTGRFRLRVEGVDVLETTLEDIDEQLGAGLLAPPTAQTPIQVRSGHRIRVEVEYTLPTVGAFTNAVSIALGTRPDTADDDRLIVEAVEVARASRAAVVVVGTDAQVESEGFDRQSLRLPGRQDDLVAAVAAVNPRTVVVVNAGAPVEMPWRNDVAAVLLVHFPGQEFGHALADVLTGRAEPGGRLPTTWPGEMADVPVLDVTPQDGKLAYTEGIHVGYKAWLRAGTEPAYGFGHGLGYTDVEIAGLDLGEVRDGGAALRVRVRNTGARVGKVVVQVYASRPDSALDRPACWLVGFATARVAADTDHDLVVDIPTRLLRHRESGGWALESGDYRLHVGLSLADALTRSLVLPVGGPSDPADR